jgi:hypothetical protein
MWPCNSEKLDRPSPTISFEVCNHNHLYLCVYVFSIRLLLVLETSIPLRYR